MRSAVGPCGLQPILFAKKQAGRLRTADAFAAAVGDGCRAALQMDIRFEGEVFGGCVDDNGNVLAPGYFGDHASAERAIVSGTTEDVNHGGAIVERRLELGGLADLDNLHAEHPDG